MLIGANEIIKGVARQLNAAFGEGYTIYQNRVRQGLQEPCFFIGVLQPEEQPLLGSRALRRNPLVIQYFPRVDGDNAEMLEAAGKMLDGLRFIRLLNGDLLLGRKMRYEIVEGILHFFVNYDLTVWRPEQRGKMEDLAIKNGIKE
ncbi:MAG: hypothetical protein NC400_14440 [Clostridium sp.]|nr:hypothetical protein [Clostridium sp.]